MPRHSRFAPERLRDARLAANLSPAALSALAKIHPSTLYEWERGAKAPSLDSYLRLVDALALPVGGLLTDCETPGEVSQKTMKRSRDDENA